MFKKGKKRWLILLAGIAAVIVIGGGVFSMVNHYISIRGQHLVQYTRSSGGGMTGGYKRLTVKGCDDTHAVIRTESAEWHNQEPEVREYLVDRSILAELEKVVRKHHMNFWNRKRFTRMFVADGESTGYYFTFDENEFGFSSQIYPAGTRAKLKELNDIVSRYREAGELILMQEPSKE